jgi:hypothetical protein
MFFHALKGHLLQVTDNQFIGKATMYYRQMMDIMTEDIKKNLASANIHTLTFST